MAELGTKILYGIFFKSTRPVHCKLVHGSLGVINSEVFTSICMNQMSTETTIIPSTECMVFTERFSLLMQ